MVSLNTLKKNFQKYKKYIFSHHNIYSLFEIKKLYEIYNSFVFSMINLIIFFFFFSCFPFFFSSTCVHVINVIFFPSYKEDMIKCMLDETVYRWLWKTGWLRANWCEHSTISRVSDCTFGHWQRAFVTPVCRSSVLSRCA